jgi:hypothetical protein
MGLLDQFSGMNEDQTQGLLAAAAQMLQQSGPSTRPSGLGQILGGAHTAYQDSTLAARKRKLDEQQAAQMAEMRALQMQEMQGGLQDSRAARAQRQAIDGAARDSMRSPGQMAGALPGGPTMENAARIPNMQGGFDQEGYIDRVMAISPMEGLKLKQQFAKTRELKETTNELVDGKTVKVNWFKDGSHEIVNGMQPRDKMEVMSLGNRKEAFNPYALKDGQKFQIGVDPDTVYSGGITMRGQDKTDARARESMAAENQRFAAGNKPMTALQETKYRTQIAKDYQSANTILANMDDVAKSAAAVKTAPGLGGATGLSAYLPSYPDSAASQAEVKLQNLEGKITNLGKAAAAMSGAVGPMAVQEWKIVRDMVAAIDPKKGEKSLKEQIALVEESAQGAASRIRDAYGKHYSADFERYPQFEQIGKKTGAPAPATAAAPMGAMPTANTSNKGRTIVDNDSGKRYRSNGLQWQEIK